MSDSPPADSACDHTTVWWQCWHAPTTPVLLSLSRLNHWLPRGQAHPEVVQGTAEFHHQITDSLLPQANPVFHDATALHTTIDMLDPEPTLVKDRIRLWKQGVRDLVMELCCAL